MGNGNFRRKRKAKGGRGEDQSFGVLGRHPETRAEPTISIVWKQFRPLSGQVASRAWIWVWERRWRGQELRRKDKD